MNTDSRAISPAIAQALSYAEKHFRSEHVLFRDIPLNTKSVGVGEVAVEITLPDAFAEGDHIFGGLYTILLDTILAVASMTRMETFMPQATINLKTDFFTEATPGTVVLCEAFCEGIVDNVAVCHGRMTHGGELIAKAQGTFLVHGANSDEKASRL